MSGATASIWTPLTGVIRSADRVAAIPAFAGGDGLVGVDLLYGSATRCRRRSPGGVQSGSAASRRKDTDFDPPWRSRGPYRSERDSWRRCSGSSG